MLATWNSGDYVRLLDDLNAYYQALVHHSISVSFYEIYQFHL